ncbi:MAG: acyl-CoA thioesterase [Myxococcota bacterium]|nr:acyl-CoA thioesterase [Myxococcota bacterium]MDW8362287.1 thioesterase family protein [Myxococcales bacterium]
MAFRASIKIRFGDEDHAGIVYYPRYFDFFHQAFEDLFESQGVPYRVCLDEDRIGWPAVHAEADFERPLRFGDVLDVDVSVERFGRSSVSFRYEGRRRADGERVVVGRTIVACVDLRTFRPMSVPTRYRDLFVAACGPAAVASDSS